MRRLTALSVPTSPTICRIQADVTNSVHYENYRCNKLTVMMGRSTRESPTSPDGEVGKDPPAEGRRHAGRDEEVFRAKVELKEEKLRGTEQEQNREIDQENKRLDNRAMSREGQNGPEKRDWHLAEHNMGKPSTQSSK